MEEENKQEQEVKNVEVTNTVETKTEDAVKSSDPNNTLALVSMILGIVAIVLMCVQGTISWVLAIAAIVLGAVSIKSESKNMAIAGLVTGIIVIALNAIIFILTLIGVGIIAAVA